MKLIDVDALCEATLYNPLHGPYILESDIIVSPKIEIITCIECRHYDTAGCNEGFGWCYRHGAGCGVMDDWFCKGGERRDAYEVD